VLFRSGAEVESDEVFAVLFEEGCDTLPPAGGSCAVTTGEVILRSQESKLPANALAPSPGGAGPTLPKGE
jgi:hypothetical protein